MFKHFVVALALIVCTGLQARAADSELQQIADALDVSTTKTFQFTANGRMFSVGQATSPVAAFPRYYVKSWTRVYDFTAGAMREEIVRTQGETPPAGGGGQPIEGDQRVVSLVYGDHAWNEAGKVAAPRVWEAADRAHQIAISPHGIVRGAFANNAAVSKKSIDGRDMTVITFSDRKQKVVAYANDQNAIEKVESWYGHPVVGDMKVVTFYGPYRDFAGVKFPSKIIQYHEGNVSLDLTVTAVQANPPLEIELPENVRTNPAPVKSEKAGEGIWHIGGGSHHSVLIEMKDYLIVVEAPQGDPRSMAVIAEAKKLVPNKPIKYLVNTHHHFDHSSGLRAYAAEGITIVTHELNRPYYESAALSSWNYGPGPFGEVEEKTGFSNDGRQHGAYRRNAFGGALSNRRQRSS